MNNTCLSAAALAIAAVLALAPLATSAAGSCSNERPKEIFAGLEAIDDAGEAALSERLRALSIKEQWSHSEWEAYTLGLADSPAANALSERRDALVATLFGVLARPPYDCAVLDELEAEIFALEREQWSNSIEQVEQRLGNSTEADYL